MAGWTLERMPPQDGKVALVTGANSGVGFEVARGLARGGARVILACRSESRALAAADAIAREAAGPLPEVLLVDMADLDSVRRAADEALDRLERIDLLVNNAAIMGLRRRTLSAQGFEVQFATNYLGHFALTGLLFARLVDSEPARVVTVGSLSHRGEPIQFDDLQSSHRYRGMAAYGHSKSANMAWAFELDRRLRSSGLPVMSVAAHPGVTRTNLMRTGLGDGIVGRFTEFGSGLVGAPTDRAALPILYAATGRNVVPGGYYGPNGFKEWRGITRPVKAEPHVRDEATGRRLWTLSEEMTGIRYPGPDTG